MILWSTIQSGVGLRNPLLFSYISQIHDPFKFMACVYKAYTSVVIYMDFKENRSEPQKQAYWYHSLKCSLGVLFI